MVTAQVKIVWARRAAKHLEAAYEYWSREHSVAAADKMLKRIFSAVELLQNYPDLGRPGRVRGTRELILKPLPYVLVYRIRERTDVIALLYGARKWPSRF